MSKKNKLNNKNKFQNTHNIDNIKISDLLNKKIFIDYYNEKCKENILLRLKKIKELSDKNNTDLYTKKDITKFCKCSINKLSKYKVKDIKNLSLLNKENGIKDDIKKCTLETLTLNKRKSTKKSNKSTKKSNKSTKKINKSTKKSNKSTKKSNKSNKKSNKSTKKSNKSTKKINKSTKKSNKSTKKSNKSTKK